ncbi:MAG: phosphate ABC transporter substrate-binding protein PstS [Nocardioidaceae bacterium]
MKSNSLPRAFKFGAVSLAVALSLTACGAANEEDTTVDSGGDTSSSEGGDAPSLSGELNGAGATSQEAAMTAWKAGFQEANPEVTVNYDPVGSGGGREGFLNGAVAFAGSDAYLDETELKAAQKTCSGDPIEIPVYVSPIAVVYNLPEVEELQLSPATLAMIFAGDITSWDDGAIAADNPDAELPSTEITPVHRSDESGTTENFTDYLSQVAEAHWTHGPVESWPIKGGEAADGTSGVISAVTEGEGTIGYADASQAGDLGQALVGVGSEFVGPTQEAAAAVLDESTPVEGRAATDMALDVNRTTEAAGVYPIVLVSYHVACSTYDDQGTAELVKAFESYVISEEGQAAAGEQAGSAPITAAIREQATAAVDTISTQ